jgi:hypothetical protein
LREFVGSGKLILLGASELLFLMRYANPIPLIYFDSASHAYYADSPEEPFSETRARVLLSEDPDAFVLTVPIEPDDPIRSRHCSTRIRSGVGSYSAKVYTRW